MPGVQGGSASMTTHGNEQMIALAERCEAAEGPSVGLDIDIWLAVVADAPSLKAYNAGLAISQTEAVFRADYMMGGVRYTASLDAALTLVPEGWVRGVEEWPDPSGAHSRAWLKQTSLNRIGRQEYWGHSTDDLLVEVKDAATPALALCAAALRARAA